MMGLAENVLVPVSVSNTSGHGRLRPRASMSLRASPAASEPEKLQRWSGPAWPEISQRLSANWNCRMVRVKYLWNWRRET